jgi:quercetin dioxygenase-like cupin family protein
VPIVRAAASLPVRRSEGVTETLAAGSEVFGVPVPLRLRRVAVDPGQSAAVDAAGAEVMAYVLAGTGFLTVGGERHALAPESMAWIDPPGPFEVVAAHDGLTLLVAEAPPGPHTEAAGGSPSVTGASPDRRR